MTASTGRRSYRACLRCRRRKTRCNLNGVGEPYKAPCMSCHSSGSECILTESRRGGNFRRRRTGSRPGPAESEPGRLHPSTSTKTARRLQPSSGAHCGAARDDSRTVLSMELRNPSDALQILTHSGGERPAKARGAGSHDVAEPGVAVSSAAGPIDCYEPQLGLEAPSTLFGDFELVQRGLLRPTLVSELLAKYLRSYHPYCPIVPSYILEPSLTGNMQKSDYFLISSILTIASRDDARHAVAHRSCWDHTRRLLVDIILADSWTQTPRTVEGLLLLAEWLPHIQTQEPGADAPKSLFSEDRTTWSLIGLAVRHGYLQHLDQSAFPETAGDDAREWADQKRLVWAYVFMADRQISVRLGQSFWSRGPSLATKFTARDFPALQPCANSDNENYAAVLQASMELVQILHNAHAILYSSKERTWAMVNEGHYSRYLDDFRDAATTWHSTWSGLPASPKIKSTLLILYEYICLYTNAFSFQAVLTRASKPQALTSSGQANKSRLIGLLASGIMTSPDGRFIFDAISAATNLLGLMNGLDPQRVLCCLPSRYYLCGVYAAVLLHRADCAGAFRSLQQHEEVATLACSFVESLEKASVTESHICRSYSGMLKQLWSSRENKTSLQQGRQGRIPSANGQHPEHASTDEPLLAAAYGHQTSFSGSLDEAQSFNSSQRETILTGFPAIGDYLLGSFMPGVAGFGMPDFDMGANALDLFDYEP